MKKLIHVLFFLCIYHLPAAQNFDSLDINNVKTHIYPSNVQFTKADSIYSETTFEFPNGSGKHTVFSSSIWLSAKNMNDWMFVSADRFGGPTLYPTFDFVSGPLDANANVHPDTILKYKRVWSITKAEIDSFQKWITNPVTLPMYYPSADLLSWPANSGGRPLAPYIDLNNNQTYDPLGGGDYPAIHGDKAIYFVLNDVGSNQEHTDGLPMGIELHCMFYAYNCKQSQAVDNTIFARYKLINRSQNIYKHFLPTLFVDQDVGIAHANYIGTDVESGMVYTYNTKPLSYPYAYGDTAVATGAVILKGSEMPPNQIDDSPGSRFAVNGSGFGDGIVDNEYYGLTNSMYFNNYPNNYSFPFHDPKKDEEYYTYSRSKFMDQTHLKHGGTGHLSSSMNCRYMFPGDSDPLNYGTNFQAPPNTIPWKEDSSIAVPDDRRAILSSGNNIFFLPGETIELHVAYTNAMVTGGNSDQVIDLIRTYADSLQYYYHNNSMPCSNGTNVGLKPAKNQSPVLKISPNPASDNIAIQTNIEERYYLKLYNLIGKTLWYKNNNTGQSVVDISHLKPGIYLLEIGNKTKRSVRKFIKH